MHDSLNNYKPSFYYFCGIAVSRELITAYKETRMAGPYKEVDVHIPRRR
jgi:hypothetical protein